ncbi:MAG TPA: Clp protease ClpP [Pseudomonadota bacterium]|nr:Clp protease ClpP [Pseudomonadota bacterium]
MIKVQAKANGTAEVLIYGPIGEDWYGNGVTAKQFRDDLKSAGDVSEIVVRVNSPGGEVFDGIAIYNELRAHKARKIVQVDGYAASIATVIAMAGDEIVLGTGTAMMIHGPSTFAWGPADTMRETADMLDKVAVGMVDAYARFNKTLAREDIEALMTGGDHWYTAAEAIKAGFATRMAEEQEPTDSTEATSAYKKAFAQVREQFSAPSLRIAAQLNPPALAVTPAIPATPKEESVMTPEQIEAAKAAARAEALQAEAARVSEIRAMFQPHSVQHLGLMSECVGDQSCTAADASKKLLAALAAGATPTAGATHNVLDQRDKFVAGASNAILARIDAGKGGEKLQAGNEYAGMGLKALIRVALRNSGVSGADRLEGSALAAKLFASHSGSDFPYLLANTAAKLLRASYANAPTTWQQWAPTMSVSDFKQHSIVSLSAFSDLATKAEGAEYTQGTLSEYRETIQASTKGRYIGLTREMVVNDDLGAFTRLASALGWAAANSVDKAVYTYVEANGTLTDGGALFNSTAVSTTGGHANLAGSGGAIAVSTIAAGEAAMAAQADPSRATVLGLRPRFLVVPYGKKQIAWEVLNSPTDVASSNSAKRNYAASLGLELVAAPNLTGSTAWYLFADKNTPCIEVAFLDGQQTPYIEEDVEFMTDEMRMKVRLDFGVAATEWRTGFKNAGA